MTPPAAPVAERHGLTVEEAEPRGAADLTSGMRDVRRVPLADLRGAPAAALPADAGNRVKVAAFNASL